MIFHYGWKHFDLTHVAATNVQCMLSQYYRILINNHINIFHTVTVSRSFLLLLYVYISGFSSFNQQLLLETCLAVFLILSVNFERLYDIQSALPVRHNKTVCIIYGIYPSRYIVYACIQINISYGWQAEKLVSSSRLPWNTVKRFATTER